MAPTPSAAQPDSTSQVLQGDCLKLLRALPDGSVDAVVTDPPWNWGKDYGIHDDAMSDDDYVEWLGARLAECARVARGAVVFTPGARNAPLVPALLARGRLRELAREGWERVEGSEVTLEPVLWCADRPAWRPATQRTPRLGTHRVGAGRGAGMHPCPKPVELMRPLVECSSPAGGSVLDPFCGTGSTLLAAVSSGRRATGMELNPSYVALARAALEDVSAPRGGVR